ncbi:MAG TPA: alkaline phosphatase family protein [Gemmatimonadaceae bacterium]
MTAATRVIVIGLDGLEPTIVDALLQAGELPHLARLRASGGYSRVATTTPANTPVAWSTFATGVNPGGHGIFDFLRRDPATYFPDLAFNRYEQPSALLPPRAVNQRGGVPLWNVLSDAGIPSTILRCPCTFPPDEFNGCMLSGMGVPDLRGGLGTSTFYSTAVGLTPRESEQVIQLTGAGPRYDTRLVGPRNPRRRTDLTAALSLEIDPYAGTASIRAEGRSAGITVRVGQWSDWLHVRFRTGIAGAVRGMVRFLLVRVLPEVELYASPVNFDPRTPMFPISHPARYAGELAGHIGDYHTSGIVEDHTGLSNGRFGETEFLAQCDGALRERERMLFHELDRMTAGFLFCLFDTPDRVQHMFWRFREPAHPANGAGARLEPAWTRVIEEHYRRCDATVGEVLRAVDDRTLLVVLSDHGFSSFRRGLSLNAWLLRNGYLGLRDGTEAGESAGEFFQGVDWSRTRAYALGLGGIYLNVKGREAEGIVEASEADRLAGELASRLAGLVDTDRGGVAIRRARTRAQVYSGPFAADAPDAIVDLAPGYRVSWTTAVGGVPDRLFEDNTRAWAGDHLIDPDLVPGVLFMNRPFRNTASLVDLAPTILGALGAAIPTHYEGSSLVAS